jgi:hypothetical protein
MPKIHTSDIAVLFQLLVDENRNIIIYNLDNQVVEDSKHDYKIVNSVQNLDKETNLILLSKLDNTVSFAVKNCIDFANNKFTRDTIFEYQYFNNPNATMRWIYPKSLKYPSFLTLYNASGLKSKLIRLAFQSAFRFGFKSKLSSGDFRLIINKENAVETLVKEARGEAYSIFTGTVGENRKAIIEVNQNRKTTNFIKVPLGEKSAKLVEKEKYNLAQLAKYNFQKAVLPKITVSKNPKVAIISNVQPNESFATLNDLTNVHLNVLEEWYDKTIQTKKVSELADFQLIKNNLAELSTYPKPQNDLEIETVNGLIDGLQLWLNQLDESQKIAVGMAHYDFAPWNMYWTKTRLHVYDWELSKPDLPLLYDAFHFIFQASILVKRSTFAEIQGQIETLKSSELTKKLNENPDFDFDTNYRFYVLSVASYYLNLYVKQSPLHEQAHWLVNIWKEAVESSS